MIFDKDQRFYPAVATALALMVVVLVTCFFLHDAHGAADLYEVLK